MPTVDVNPFLFNSIYAAGSVQYNNPNASTWGTVRNGTTGTSVVQSGNTNADIQISATPSGRGYRYSVARSFINFLGLGAYAPNITALSLKLPRVSNSSINPLDVIVLEGNAFGGGGGSTLITADYDEVDFATTYSSVSTWPNSNGTQTITLNAAAISYANANSDLNIAVVDNDSDYADADPSGLNGGSAFDYFDTINWNSPLKITLSVTYSSSGYSHDVNGVLSANIGSINGVATANIDSMNGV